MVELFLQTLREQSAAEEDYVLDTSLFQLEYFNHLMKGTQNACLIFNLADASLAFISESSELFTGMPAQQFAAQWPTSTQPMLLMEEQGAMAHVHLKGAAPFIATPVQDNRPRIFTNTLHYRNGQTQQPAWALMHSMPLAWKPDGRMTYLLQYYIDITELPLEHGWHYYVSEYKPNHQLGQVVRKVNEQTQAQARANLSEEELAYLQLLTLGLEREEIAQYMNLSAHQIDHLRRNLQERTGVSSSTGLVHYAFAAGLVL